MGMRWKRLMGRKEGLCNTFNNEDEKKKILQKKIKESTLIALDQCQRKNYLIFK